MQNNNSSCALSRTYRIAFAACLLAGAVGVHAADEPVYEPAPEWVVHAALPEIPTVEVADEDSVEVILWDQQVHFDDDGPHAYIHIALHINSVQGLMEVSTLSAEWFPQFETLTIHQVNLHRGPEVIDALGDDRRFLVLQRERNLELAILDGALTAVLQPEGLRVGDVVEFAYTLSGADPALGGMLQRVMTVPQFPAVRTQFRASWDQSLDVRWQATDALINSVRERQDGRDRAIELNLESPEPEIPPIGAPARYLVEPNIELSSYATWQQVSMQIAPLFESASELPENSVVREQIDRIRAEYDSPLEQASAALRMVQDEVRYLYVGLEYGGLVPASAEQTWSRRFGDCKGKTALLLAMFDELGIQAEPVLVQTFAGDALPDRLPMIAAFDHVIVRAVIEDDVYWLDGTNISIGSIQQLQTPLFHWGLPVREQGAELEAIQPAPLTSPDTIVSVHLDFSAGVSAPGQIEGEIVLSGPSAEIIRQNASLMTPEETEATYRGLWSTYYPAARVDAVTGRFETSSGEYSIAMSGAVPSLWFGNRYESIVGDFIFYESPDDRPPGQDQSAPYSIQFPFYVQVQESLTLPQGGQGFTLDGDEVDITAMGMRMTRTARIDESSVVIEGTARSLQSEVSAVEMRNARRRVEALRNTQFYVRAPANYRASAAEQDAALGPEPVSADDFYDRGLVHVSNSRWDPAIVDLTAAIDLVPDYAYALATRGLAFAWKQEIDLARQDLEAAEVLDPSDPVVFRAYGLIALQQSDYSEAIEKFSRAIEIDNTDEFSYRMRTNARRLISDLDGAFSDSQVVTRLNPAWAEMYYIRAMIHGMRGRDDLAIDEVEAMLDTATVDPRFFRQAALELARLGERQSAIRALGMAFEVQPAAGDMVMSAGLRDASEIAERLADLEAALEVDPNFREARLLIAGLHIDAGRPNEAISYLDPVIASNANDSVALLERGVAFSLSDEDSLAEFDLDSALAHADTPSSLNAMCWRMATLGVALEYALKACLQAIEMDSRAAFYDSLGLVYFRLGRFQDAISAYDAALELQTDMPASLFGRAHAKKQLGDEAGFRRDMEGATRAAPGIAEEYESFYSIVP